MKQIVLKFGLLALAVLILLQLSKYSIVTRSFSNEWLIALFAGLFILLGVIVSKVIKTKEQVSSPESVNKINLKKLASLGISKREYEVLQLIAEGYSNQEIAQNLFISESTVKTHVSNLLMKLNAKRRTQALTIAKEEGIL